MGDVAETLIQLLWVASVSTAALQVVFDTNLYKVWLGKGLDGNGSKWFKTFELRPWLSMALGVYLAYAFEMTAIIEGLGINLEDLLAVKSEASVHADLILTGVSIGGGTKTIKAIAKNFASGRKEVTNALAG